MVKKILIAVSQLNTGGTEVLSVLLANTFSSQKNIECTIISMKLENPSVLESKKPGVNVTLLKGGIVERLFVIRRFYNEYAPDYVLCQTLYSYFLLRLALSFNKRGKFFLAIHYTVKYRIVDYLLSRSVFRMVKQSSDEIIFSYKTQKKIFCDKYKLPLKKVHIIYNGTIISQSGKKKEYYDNGVLRILHVANFRKEKDQLTLFKALSILKTRKSNWSVSIRGFFPAEIQSRFENYCGTEGILEKVTFVKYTSDMKELYEKHDIFVLSSISEALPMTAIEACNNGLPCILTNVGGCSEIIDDSINGYIIPPADPIILAERIESFINSPEKICEYGLSAREKAEKYFNIDKNARDYLEIFEGNR